MKRTVNLIGARMDLGASKRGASLGPAAIRLAGLRQGLESLGYRVKDLGDVQPLTLEETEGNLRCAHQVTQVDREVYDRVLESLEEEALPMLLGGDHSIAAGSIAAVSQYYARQGKSIGVIWIDAHGDWNNQDSTLSGNMHGMPFSAVCGFGPDCMVNFGQAPAYVDVTHCVQIGGRDIDSAERLRMKEAGVTTFSINMIDQLGMAEVMRRAIEVAGTGTAGIHLSFDVDAITPEAAPGTGTVVHSGLTTREAFLAVESLSASQKLLSMDMVEVNPILDVRNKTGILASELVQSALGKVVF